MGEKVASAAGAIIVLATVAVVFQSANTSKVISAAGSAFIGSVKAAMGNLGN